MSYQIFIENHHNKAGNQKWFVYSYVTNVLYFGLKQIYGLEFLRALIGLSKMLTPRGIKRIHAQIATDEKEWELKQLFDEIKYLVCWINVCF